MNLSRDELVAQVAANNRAAEAAAQLAALLAEAMRPFVGRKIRKATGELTENFRAALPKEKPLGCEWHFSQCCSTSGLVWVSLQTFERIPKRLSVVYSRNGDFPIGQHDRNVLSSVQLPEKKPTWTLQQVLLAVERNERAQEAARSAQSQLVTMGVPV